MQSMRSYKNLRAYQAAIDAILAISQQLKRLRG